MPLISADASPVTDSEDLISIVTDVLRQAPQWIRTDLVAKGPALRTRAEDALAAMIAAALGKAERVTVEQPRTH